MEEKSKAIQVFNFQGHDFRVVVVNGNPWFVISDVCKVLELGNVSRVIDRLDSDGVTQSKVTDSLGRMQDMAVANEPNLYRLIFRSKKPEAKAFQDIVFNEVLPSIRKTGSYGAPAKPIEPPPLLFATGEEAMAAKPLCPCPTRQELETAILSMIDTLYTVTKSGVSVRNLLGYSQECHAYIRAHDFDPFEAILTSLVKRRMLTTKDKYYYFPVNAGAAQIEAPRKKK